jgi:chromosome segregation ATPase
MNKSNMTRNLSSSKIQVTKEAPKSKLVYDVNIIKPNSYLLKEMSKDGSSPRNHMDLLSSNTPKALKVRQNSFSQFLKKSPEKKEIKRLDSTKSLTKSGSKPRVSASNNGNINIKMNIKNINISPNRNVQNNHTVDSVSLTSQLKAGISKDGIGMKIKENLINTNDHSNNYAYNKTASNLTLNTNVNNNFISKDKDKDKENSSQSYTKLASSIRLIDDVRKKIDDIKHEDSLLKNKNNLEKLMKKLKDEIVDISRNLKQNEDRDRDREKLITNTSNTRENISNHNSNPNSNLNSNPHSNLNSHTSPNNTISVNNLPHSHTVNNFTHFKPNTATNFNNNNVGNNNLTYNNRKNIRDKSREHSTENRHTSNIHNSSYISNKSANRSKDIAGDIVELYDRNEELNKELLMLKEKFVDINLQNVHLKNQLKKNTSEERVNPVIGSKGVKIVTVKELSSNTVNKAYVNGNNSSNNNNPVISNITPVSYSSNKQDLLIIAEQDSKIKSLQEKNNNLEKTITKLESKLESNTNSLSELSMKNKSYQNMIQTLKEEKSNLQKYKVFDPSKDKIKLQCSFKVNDSNNFVLISDPYEKIFTWVNLFFSENKEIENLLLNNNCDNNANIIFDENNFLDLNSFESKLQEVEAEFEGTKKYLINEIEIKENNLNEYKNEIEKWKKKAHKMNETIETLKNKFKESEEKLREYNDEIEILSNALNERENMEENYKAHIEEMEIEKENLINKISDFEKEIAEFSHKENENNKLQEEIEKLKYDREEDYSTLTAEIDKLKQENENYVNQIYQLKDELDQTMTKLTNDHKKISHLEKEILRSRVNSELIHKEKEDLQVKVNSLNLLIERLEKEKIEINNKEYIINELKSEIENLNKKIEISEKEISSKEENLNNLFNSIIELNGKNKILENDNQKKIKQISLLTEKLNNLESQTKILKQKKMKKLKNLKMLL